MNQIVLYVPETGSIRGLFINQPIEALRNQAEAEGLSVLMFDDSEQLSIRGKKVVEGHIVDDPEQVAFYVQEAALGNRTALLAATDWLSIRHRDQVDAGLTPSLTPVQYEELLIYRQALRDWPVSGNFEDSLPAPPGWGP